MTTYLYTSPITISTTTTLKFRAVAADGTVGDLQTAVYYLPPIGTEISTLTALTLSATGSSWTSGIFNKSLGGIITSTSGKVYVSGTLSKSLSGISFAASASTPVIYFSTQPYVVGSTVYYGTADTLSQNITLSTTLAPATLQSGGLVKLSGQTTITLGVLTNLSTSITRITGNTTFTLSPLIPSILATHPVIGSITNTLVGLTATSTSIIRIVSNNTNTLQNLTASVSGTTITNTPVLFFTQQPYATIDDTIITFSYGTGYLYDSLTYGSVSANLSNLTVAGIATGIIDARASITFTNITTAVNSAVIVSSSLSQSLSGIAFDANGFINTIPTIIALNTTLSGLTGLAAGSVLISGHTSITMNNVSGNIIGNNKTFAPNSTFLFIKIGGVWR